MEPIIGNQTTVSENTSFAAPEKATFGDRFFAAFVDGLMINLPTNLFIIIFISGQMLTHVTTFTTRIIASLVVIIIQLAVNLGYYGVYACYRNGQTLGKKWNNIKVVDNNGNDLSLSHFLGRTFIARGILVLGFLVLNNLAYLWLLTYLFALGKERSALHDMIAGTKVIKIK